jgi:hypothetical protein
MIRLLANFASSEAGWFACVLGAAYGQPWIGPVVVLVLVSIHLGLVKKPGDEVRLMLAAVSMGLLADSLLVATGLVSYPNGTWIPGFAPYWILAMWAMFATTLNMSMRWLRGRTLLAALLGAIFGPLAYLAGEELGAIRFEERTLAIAALAVIWTVCMPLLVGLASRWNGVSEPRRPGYILNDWKVNTSV